MTGTSARSDASHVDRTMDRRQLLRAGAWAAPVIVLAAAVPAAAASGDGEVTPGSSNPGIDSLRFADPAVWQGGSRWNVGTPWEGSEGVPGRIIGNFWIENRNADQTTGTANTTAAAVTVVVTRSDLPGESKTFTYAIAANGQASEDPFTWDNPSYTRQQEVTVTFTASAAGFVGAPAVSRTVTLN